MTKKIELGHLCCQQLGSVHESRMCLQVNRKWQVLQGQVKQLHTASSTPVGRSVRAVGVPDPSNDTLPLYRQEASS